MFVQLSIGSVIKNLSEFTASTCNFQLALEAAALIDTSVNLVPIVILYDSQWFKISSYIMHGQR